ncbi:MAG: hypothetical protein IJC82_01920 [Firmicutes bacterium]|nr:hypothetical protein [Bacillota bacterium]
MKHVEDLSKEELLELIKIYGKNWLALDGVWFQSIEQKYGIEEAVYHDAEAWKRYTVIEAKRIKEFCKMEEHPGLDGLEQAFRLRIYANINPFTVERAGNKLVMKVTDCRVQTARHRKQMELHPCKSVGIIEHEGFAKTIDSRISCRCLSCPPEVTDNTCACAWEFTLEE